MTFPSLGGMYQAVFDPGVIEPVLTTVNLLQLYLLARLTRQDQLRLTIVQRLRRLRRGDGAEEPSRPAPGASATVEGTPGEEPRRQRS